MSRNYEKEYKWQKEKYDIIRASINKELGTKLRLKLKKDNLTISKWICQNATKYINE